MVGCHAIYPLIIGISIICSQSYFLVMIEGIINLRIIERCRHGGEEGYYGRQDPNAHIVIAIIHSLPKILH